jgi:hypothetical protein
MGRLSMVFHRVVAAPRTSAPAHEPGGGRGASRERPGEIEPLLVVAAVARAAGVLRPGSRGGGSSSLVTRFLGLILIAMRLSFVLTNLREFSRAF